MSEIKNENIWLITGSLVFLAFVALAFTLYFTKVFMIPFVLAVFVVFLVAPLLDFQVQKLKIPHALAVALTLLFVLAIIVLAGGLFTSAVKAIINTADQYSENISITADKVVCWLGSHGVNIDTAQFISSMKTNVPTYLQTTFSPILSATSWLFLTIVFITFLLAGRHPGTINKGVLGEIDSKVRYYIFLKVICSAVTGLGVWIVLSLFRLELAGVFGLLAFLLNFIPSIGSLAATLLPLPVAVVQYESSLAITMVILLPGAIQILIGNFVEPKFQGQSMKLHPVVILMALSFWGILWGIVGMLLAVPVTAITRIVFMQFDLLRPIGKLMAGNIEFLNIAEPKTETD